MILIGISENYSTAKPLIIASPTCFSFLNLAQFLFQIHQKNKTYAQNLGVCFNLQSNPVTLKAMNPRF
jgi:hypothetical protein